MNPGLHSLQLLSGYESIQKGPNNVYLHRRFLLGTVLQIHILLNLATNHPKIFVNILELHRMYVYPDKSYKDNIVLFSGSAVTVVVIIIAVFTSITLQFNRLCLTTLQYSWNMGGW